MKIGTVSVRRFVPGIFLLAALFMLILGLSVFSPKLKGTAFVTYWLICFLLTGAAAIMAIIDVALIRRESTKKQSELIESTLAEAQSDRAKDLSLKK